MSLLGVINYYRGRKTLNFHLKIIGFIATICFLLLFLSAQPGYTQDIAVAPTIGAYNDVQINTTATQTFVVSNTDTIGNLIVNAPTLTGVNADQFTVSPIGGFTVPAGGSQNVVVNFTPTSVGLKTATLGFTSNDPDVIENPLNVPLSGNGVVLPDIAVAPTIGAYNDVQINTTATQTFVVSNTGTGDLIVNAPTLTGVNADQFTVSPIGGFTVPAGGSQNVVVSFTPTTVGLKTATLGFTSNDPDVIENPLNVPLSGNSVLPDIAVAPTIGAYNDVQINTTATQTFVVSNTGTGDLIVNAPTLTGVNADQFTVSPIGGFTVPAGGSQNVVVNFTPTSVGLKTATLRFTSNDPDENPLNINLLGRGITPEDNDGDGLADGWEQQIIDADPNDGIVSINDVNPDDDFDGDGLTNVQEFNAGSDPTNARPDTPVLRLPANGVTGVSLTPQLQTEAFNDPEDDGHYLTRWQISTDPTFADDQQLALDLISDTHLISIDVPGLVLDLDTPYYWRAAFTDGAGQISAWPDEPFAFTTDDVDENDSNVNGIPDDQETDCTALFGDEDVPPNTLCVNSSVGGGAVGIEGSTNVTSIEAYRSVDPADIPELLTGVELQLGLMSFKAVCDNVGDTIEVIYHLSGTIPAGSKIYKWDSINGWREHANAQFLPDGKSVLIRVTDGGDGDLDNVANGVVIDPSGVGTAIAAGGAAPTGGSSGGYLSNIECFIAVTRTEFPMMGELLALLLLLGCGIFALGKIKRKSQKS